MLPDEALMSVFIETLDVYNTESAAFMKFCVFPVKRVDFSQICPLTHALRTVIKENKVIVKKTETNTLTNKN